MLPHEVGDSDGECGRSSCPPARNCPSGHSHAGSALRRCRCRPGFGSGRRRWRSRRRFRLGTDVAEPSRPRHRRADHAGVDWRNRRSRQPGGAGFGDDHRLRRDRIGQRDRRSLRLRRRWSRLGCSGTRRRLLSGRWRRRGSSRRRDWGGRRRGCRRRVGGTPQRKQAEWVDVGVLADPNAEMDIWNRMFGVAGRPEICDRVSLRDDRSLPDAQRSEVCERHHVAVGGDDRHREAVGWDLPGERHLPGRGRPYRRRAAYGDVDSAMLTRGVLVSTDRVAPKHLAISGPHPSPRGCSGAERPDDGEGSADDPARCPVREHGATVASVVRDGNAIYCLVTESPGRGRFGTFRSGALPPPPQLVATHPRRRDP